MLVSNGGEMGGMTMPPANTEDAQIKNKNV